MIKKLLFAPDGGVALAPAPAAPAAPSKPAAAPSAPAAPAAAPEPPPSDDPFEPPKKAATAPASKPAANTTPPVAPDIDKLAPKELRERVKQLNAEKLAFAEKEKSYETRIREYDEKIRQAEARGTDTAALIARQTAVERERDEAQANLRAAKQELDPAFIQKYEKPINDLAEYAKSDFNALNILDADENPVRKADWDTDFKELYALYLKSPQAALKQSKEMFGAGASEVDGMMSKFKGMQRERDIALTEERKNFKSKNDKDIAEQAKNREGVGKLWMDTNKRLSQSDSYKVDATDAELSEAAKHAETVFDSQINAADKDDFVKQKVLKDAHIKQKTIGYSVRGIIINRLKSENETLKKQIEELKGTAPGGTQRGGGAEPEKPLNDDNWAEEAINFVKKNAG